MNTKVYEVSGKNYSHIITTGSQHSYTVTLMYEEDFVPVKEHDEKMKLGLFCEREGKKVSESKEEEILDLMEKVPAPKKELPRKKSPSKNPRFRRLHIPLPNRAS